MPALALGLPGARLHPALLRALHAAAARRHRCEGDDRQHCEHDHDYDDEAPDVETDVELTEEQERLLHEHYGRDWAPPSGSETDTAMTRSEEEVEFGKRATARAERVRLKKVLVEDEVTQTVPVRREEIRLETDPPPEGMVESVEAAGSSPRS